MSKSTEGKDLELTAAELEAAGKLTDSELEAVVGGSFFKKLQSAERGLHSLYGQLTEDQKRKLKIEVKHRIGQQLLK